VGLAPVGCGCRFEFTPMGKPAPDPGWQRARVSICTRGSLLGACLQPMYYNFGSQNPQAPETCPKIRWHLKPTLKPADTRWLMPCQNPRAPETRRVRVQFSTHVCGCRFSPISILEQGGFFINPPRCHPYLYSELFLQNTPHTPLVAWTEVYLGE
jgi:hypothetical protein